MNTPEKAARLHAIRAAGVRRWRAANRDAYNAYHRAYYHRKKALDKAAKRESA